jgi:hypothetical protein
MLDMLRHPHVGTQHMHVCGVPLPEGNLSSSSCCMHWQKDADCEEQGPGQGNACTYTLRTCSSFQIVVATIACWPGSQPSAASCSWSVEEPAVAVCRARCGKAEGRL